jgi:hypothetical protein
VHRTFFSIRSLAAEGGSAVADDDFIPEGSFQKSKRVVHHLRRQQQFLQANFPAKGLLCDLCGKAFDRRDRQDGAETQRKYGELYQDRYPQTPT